MKIRDRLIDVFFYAISGPLHLLGYIGFGIAWFFRRLRLISAHSYERLTDHPSGSSLFPLAAFLMMIVFVVFAVVLFVFPDAYKSILAIIGIITASIAASIRAAVVGLKSRAKLLILEELSHGTALTREELKQRVLQHSWPYRRFTNLYAEALTELCLADRVAAKAGTFRLMSLDASSQPRP